MFRSVRILTIAFLAIGAFVSVLGTARAEDPPVVGKQSKLQLSGVGWVTYRYLLNDEPVGSIAGQQLSGSDMNSFDVDRVYLTGDYAFDDRFGWQTQIEMSDFDGEIKVWMKKAYVQVKKPFGLQNNWIRMGMIPNVMTPTVEKVWGFRSVSQVSIDRYLGVATTWVGAGFGGAAGEVADYEVTITNEKCYNKADNSKYKTFAGRLTLTPMADDETMKGLKVALWAMANSNLPGATFAPSASDNLNVWYGVFPHFVAKKYAIGLAFDQKLDKFPTADDETDTKTSRAISAFGSLDLTERTRGFARLDLADPNTDSKAEGDKITTINAGLAHSYVKGVRSIVDVEYTTYEEPDPLPEGLDGYDADITLSARIEVSL